MILFSGHPNFLELAKGLAQEGHNIATLAPQLANALQAVDVPARYIGDAAVGLDKQAFSTAVSILKAIEDAPQTNGKVNPAKQFVQKELATWLYPRLPELVKLTLVLDITKPSLVVVHNDIEPVTKMVAHWAKVRGVPCLHIPHAIYQDINRGRPGTDVHDIITASKLAVAGPFQRKWYEARGVPSGAIRETGLPLFDKWYINKISKNQARSILGLSLTDPVITYCSTWVQHTNVEGFNNEWEITYRNILAAVARTNVQLVVKCHPAATQDNIDFHTRVADEMGIKCWVTAQHLEITLIAADIVAAYASNTIIDGAFAKDCRLVAIRGYEDDPEVINATPENVGQVLRQAAQQQVPDYTGFLRKWAGPEGPSTPRIHEYIMELCPVAAK